MGICSDSILVPGGAGVQEVGTRKTAVVLTSLPANSSKGRTAMASFSSSDRGPLITQTNPIYPKTII